MGIVKTPPALLSRQDDGKENTTRERAATGATMSSGNPRDVGQEYVPVAKRSRADQLQGKPVLQAFEHRLPLAEHDRIQQELIFIDQSLLSKLRNDAAASENRQVLPGSLLPAS